MIAFGALKKQSIVDERTFQQKQLEDTQKADEAQRMKIMEEEKAAALVKAQKEKNELYASSCAEFTLAVENFIRTSENIEGVVKDASDADK